MRAWVWLNSHWFCQLCSKLVLLSLLDAVTYKEQRQGGEAQRCGVCCGAKVRVMRNVQRCSALHRRRRSNFWLRSMLHSWSRWWSASSTHSPAMRRPQSSPECCRSAPHTPSLDSLLTLTWQILGMLSGADGREVKDHLLGAGVVKLTVGRPWVLGLAMCVIEASLVS